MGGLSGQMSHTALDMTFIHPYQAQDDRLEVHITQKNTMHGIGVPYMYSVLVV